MALDYAYDSEQHLVALTGSGTVSVEERTSCVRRMLRDPSLPERAAVLIDVCAVENPPCDTEVVAVGALVKELQGRFGRRLAIVNTTVGHVTLSHLVAFAADDGDGAVRAFVSGREARAWLGEGRAARSGAPPTAEGELGR